MTLNESFSSKEIRNYYDRNTARFLMFGGAPAAGAIHRKLWGPGVQNQHEALLYVNQLIASSLRLSVADTHARNRILDLGCGIGGTAIWLASTFPVDICGITISPVQLREARRRASKATLMGAVEFHQGDFHALSTAEPWDAAYAIESFSHARSAKSFLKSVSQQLRPSARLILVDDFLWIPDGNNSIEVEPEQPSSVERFRRGWRLGNLIGFSQLEQAAGQTGFELISSTNLTEFIRLPRGVGASLRRWFSKLPSIGHYWSSLAGGFALQHCLQHGWIEYRLIELERI